MSLFVAIEVVRVLFADKSPPPERGAVVAIVVLVFAFPVIRAFTALVKSETCDAVIDIATLTALVMSHFALTTN